MTAVLVNQLTSALDANDAGKHVLVGLVGRGIQLSRTPAMHESEGAARGFKLVYQLIDTETHGPNPPSLSEIIHAAEICGFAGLNITFPYKLDVIESLDELSDAAQSIGAVNTVVFRDGRRFGHNTDRWGFAESFRHNMADVSKDVVLLLGAGGAGAAVASALLECGVSRLLVADTDAGKARELAAALTVKYGGGRAEAVGDIGGGVADRANGIVNATPMGMASMPGSPFPVELLRADMWVADIIYFPMETELLRAARAKGCQTFGGDGMAVFQAVRAFELFTGIKPDTDRMKAAFAAFDRVQGGV